MNPQKEPHGIRLVTKISMAACAGVEANLNDSKCERKLNKNKLMFRVFYAFTLL